MTAHLVTLTMTAHSVFKKFQIFEMSHEKGWIVAKSTHNVKYDQT